MLVKCWWNWHLDNSDLAGWNEGHDEEVKGEEETMHENFFENVETNRKLEDVERTLARTLGAKI